MATFTNRATLSYNNVVTTSNTTTGEIIQSLTITKTAVVDSYSPDGKITYVISLTNLSAISYSDITLTDDLGGYTLNGDTLYPLSYIEGSVLYYNNGVSNRSCSNCRPSPYSQRYFGPRRRKYHRDLRGSRYGICAP